jgi:hypothetical protein
VVKIRKPIAIEDCESLEDQQISELTAKNDHLYEENERFRSTLNRLSVASCNCLTATPEVFHHRESCPYRIIQEALHPLVTVNNEKKEKG